MFTADDLKEYGKVEKCEEVNGTFEVKITDGFIHTAQNVFFLMCQIYNATQPTYTIVRKCVTEPNLFHLILKKSNQ